MFFPLIQIWIVTFGFKIVFDCQNYCYLISDFQKDWIWMTYIIFRNSTKFNVEIGFEFLRWFSNWHFQISYTFLTLLIIILSWYFLILPTYTFLIPLKFFKNCFHTTKQLQTNKKLTCPATSVNFFDQILRNFAF